MNAAHNARALYSLKELRHIANFLYDSFISVLNGNPSLPLLAPRRPVLMEVARLQKKRKRSGSEPRLGKADFAELISAIKSPFGYYFESVKKASLRRWKLATKRQATRDPVRRRSFAARLAKHLVEEFCRTHRDLDHRDKRIVISLSTLTNLAAKAKIPPVFAPVAVWLLTRARDIETTALCGAGADRRE